MAREAKKDPSELTVEEKLCDNIDDVKAEINRKIGDPKYINWNIESKFKNGETLKEATNIEYKFVDYKAEHVVTLSAKDKTEYVMGNIKFPISWVPKETAMVSVLF